MTSFSTPQSSIACWLLSVLGLLLLSTPPNTIANAEFVALTDQTFEHQTQASTGMTTGSWLVLFGIPNCESCELLKPVLKELGDDEELYESGIVTGSVNCSENQDVCFRFSTTKVPVLMYLHKKRLYRYPRDEEFGSPPTLEDLKSFVLRDFAEKSEAEAIPDPPSAMEAFLNPIMAIYESNPLAGYAIFGMAGTIGFTILILVAALIKSGTSSDSDEKGKSKGKTSKKNK
mmetsp:Transcript_95/g.275  ORF Transcript_95/g.275 Transcript_95/m.275 type:complete len:231 (-) Transcript_95:95-787(-)